MDTTDSTVAAKVRRAFAAPAEVVFDSWLSPDSLGAWMFGPSIRDEEVVRISTDPRVGGAFSFVVRRNGQEFDHVGKYLEIDRPRRLAFTWGVAQGEGDTSRVVIEILPLHSGCDLTLTHEMEQKWADFVSRSEASWGYMLDMLAAAVERPV